MKDFGGTAQSLARSPLGIIALFIALIYGFASLVVGGSSVLAPYDRTLIVWFMTIFPVIVLATFAWLVSRHHLRLYSPSDFKNDKDFLLYARPDLYKFRYIHNGDKKDERKVNNATTADDWEKDRVAIYENNRGYFIAHVLEPTEVKGQEYDIFIYLIKHKSEDYSDVVKAEFFFGPYWGNKLYVGSKVGDTFGVRTSAYGPVLALCRITFTDGTAVTINKYIDFEMGFAVKGYLEKK